MSFKMRSYEKQELFELLRDFIDKVSKLRDLSDLPTWEWTEMVLDYFANAVPERGVIVDASHKGCSEGKGRGPRVLNERLRAVAGEARRTYGECLFDLTHWSLPSYEGKPYGTSEWWDDALTQESPPKMLLALESEMGKRNSSPATYRMIMDDASKLLAASCRFKVVVFASSVQDDQERIFKTAERMAKHDRTAQFNEEDTAISPLWAWIDLPWWGTSDTWVPKARVFSVDGEVGEITSKP